MAAKRTLLTQLADTPTLSAADKVTPQDLLLNGTTPPPSAADNATPPAGAPPPYNKPETAPTTAMPPTGTAAPTKEPSRKLVAVEADPHAVWSALVRTPQGQRLTDSRIHSLSPQRFDTVLLGTLKAAFLAGWDARKEVEK